MNKIFISKPIDFDFDFDTDDFSFDIMEAVDNINEELDEPIYDENVMEDLFGTYNEEIFEDGFKIIDVLELCIDTDKVYMTIKANKGEISDNNKKELNNFLNDVCGDSTRTTYISVDGDYARDDFDINGYYETVEHYDGDGEVTVDFNFKTQCNIDKVEQID